MILHAVEAHALTVLQPLAGDDVTVRAGPLRPPASDALTDSALLELCARELRVEPPRDGDFAGARGSARRVVVAEWAADGERSVFTLAPEQLGELQEVESPRGFTARRGDAYTVDDASLRFYRAPAAGADVVARVAGEPARGFFEQRPCSLELALRACALDVSTSDALLVRALAALHQLAARLPNLEALHLEGTDVAARLLRPQLGLHGCERAFESGVYCATATLTMRGLLDLSVVSGDPEAQGTIDDIVYRDTSAGG